MLKFVILSIGKILKNETEFSWNWSKWFALPQETTSYTVGMQNPP